MGFDSGYDLTNLTSDLYLRAKKLFGFFYCLTGNDLANLELQLLKILKCDLCFWLKINSGLLFLSSCTGGWSSSTFAITSLRSRRANRISGFSTTLLPVRIQAKSIQ